MDRFTQKVNIYEWARTVLANGAHPFKVGVVVGAQLATTGGILAEERFTLRDRFEWDGGLALLDGEDRNLAPGIAYVLGERPLDDMTIVPSQEDKRLLALYEFVPVDTTTPERVRFRDDYTRIATRNVTQYPDETDANGIKRADVVDDAYLINFQPKTRRNWEYNFELWRNSQEGRAPLVTDDIDAQLAMLLGPGRRA